MHRRRRRLPVFIVFFLLSLFIFTLTKYGALNGVIGLFQSITAPVQRYSFLLFHPDDNSEMTKLKNENRELRTQLVKIKELEKDNKALRDQFAITNPSPQTLIPAYILSMPSFIPRLSPIDQMILDKGSTDKVKIGKSVVFKDNLIGKIVKTTPHASVVSLLNNKTTSFTAMTSKTGAVGIIKGTGEEKMVLDNVLLSDKLQVGDTIITKEAPPLVVGKITSVSKKNSALFQSAGAQSLIDVTKLKMVFIRIDN